MQLVLNTEQAFHLNKKLDAAYVKLRGDEPFVYYEGGIYSLKNEARDILSALASVYGVEGIVTRVCQEANSKGLIADTSKSLSYETAKITLDARECFFIRELLER